MANNYFNFKQFTIQQEQSAFKVGTDGVLLGACAELSEAKKILDIGTGTGLIAIMAAQRCNAEIIAIEPDKKSFCQASENINVCKWKSRIYIENTDFHNYYNCNNVKFDIILTNPPFFRDSLRNPEGEKSATRHSESLTSFEILEGAAKLLTKEGSLQLILPYVEGNIFIAEAIDFGFFCNRIIKIKPYPEADIKRLILLFERGKKLVTEKFLTIETGVRHRYTEEYKEVTKDFYLNF
jgi:tRNA1Val (adenine37-N6)-methyltransferase